MYNFKKLTNIFLQNSEKLLLHGGKFLKMGSKNTISYYNIEFIVIYN